MDQGLDKEGTCAIIAQVQNNSSVQLLQKFRIIRDIRSPLPAVNDSPPPG
jgi:hypothetical protein